MKDLKKTIYNFKNPGFHLSWIEIKQEQLEKEILPEELEKYRLITHQKRKKEFQYVRYLRNVNLGPQAILYDKIGKPSIEKNSVFISISHSKNFVALAHANFPIGIDIEELNPRILKVFTRFLHLDEEKLFDLNSITELTVAWTIKEVLFKLNKRVGIDFKNELRIKSKKGATFFCEMRSEKEIIQVSVESFAHKNLIISYNLNK